MATSTRARGARPVTRVGPAEARLAALGALTLVVAYGCWLLARPFLGPLTWAGVLALVTFPLHAWMLRRVGGRKGLAAGLSVAVVTLAIILPAVGLAAAVVREARRGAEMLGGDFRGRWDALKERSPRLRPVLEGLERRATAPVSAAGSGASEGGDGTQPSDGDAPDGSAAGGASSSATGILTGTIRAGTEFLITLFALFFFYRDADAVRAGLRGLLPMSRRRADRVLRKVADAVWATTYGTLVVAAVQGAIGGVTFWLLGLPAPVLWGVVMGLLALIPVLGAFVVWVPAAIVLALQGEWAKAVILTATGSVVIGLVDNLLYPSLVGGRMRLHTLVVFISMLGGLSLFGASGLFIGPALVTFALELRRTWRSGRGRRGMAPALTG